MNKFLIAAAVLLLVSNPAFAGNKHKRYHGGHNNYYHGGNNNYYHGGNNYYYGKNKYHYNNNNNFYQDPNFWGGLVGGLVGGAIIDGIQRDQQQCREVVTQVYVDGIGYRQGTVVVCD